MKAPITKIVLTLSLFALLAPLVGCDEYGYGRYYDSILQFDVYDSWSGGGSYGYDDYYYEDYYEEEYYEEDYYDDYWYDDWWKKKQ